MTFAKTCGLLFVSFFMIATTVAHASEDKICAFGEDLTALKSNRRFKQRELFATFKQSREKDPVNPLLWVHVRSLKDTRTGREYQINATYDDAYDGGNTVGWIEDVTQAADGIDDSAKVLTGTGAAVAEISDSSITCNQEVK